MKEFNTGFNERTSIISGDTGGSGGFFIAAKPLKLGGYMLIIREAIGLTYTIDKMFEVVDGINSDEEQLILGLFHHPLNKESFSRFLEQGPLHDQIMKKLS